MDQMTQEPQVPNLYPVNPMPVSPTPPPTSPMPTSPMSTPVPTSGLVYASFGERFLASLIDGLIMLAVGFGMGLLAVPLTLVLGEDSALGGMVSLMISLISNVISAAYFIYFIGSSGATLGKKAMKIKVIKTDGSVPGYLTAFLREFVGKFVSSIILGIGYLWMLWDPNKQCLHDKIATTFVVKS